MFGVMPKAAWIRSSSSFASPVAVAGSSGVKRGIAAPFVGMRGVVPAHQLMDNDL
jgi:hypothetical protein